jgi:Flp pilus assembly protein TadG
MPNALNLDQSTKSKSVGRWIVRLFSDRGGHMAMMTALLAPVLIGLAGGAVDVSSFLSH